MTQTKLETIPVTWSDENDGAFFALVRDVFRPAFTSGATALLMSYDEDSGAHGGSPGGAGVSVRYSATVQSPVTCSPSAENRN